MVDVRILYHFPTAQKIKKNNLTPIKHMVGGRVGEGSRGCSMSNHKAVVVCMHLNHIRYDDWGIICQDCGEDLSENREAIRFYMPDNTFEKWYGEGND